MQGLGSALEEFINVALFNTSEFKRGGEKVMWPGGTLDRTQWELCGHKL